MKDGPGLAHGTLEQGLRGRRSEATVDPLFVLTGAGPVALIALLVADPVAAAAALAVALGAGLVAWSQTEDLFVSVAAASLSVLLLPADPLAVVVLAGVLFLFAAERWWRAPFILGLAAPAWFLPGAVGPWAAAVVLALLVSVAIGQPRHRALSRGVAGASLVIGLMMAPLLAGTAFGIGLAAYLVADHPGRTRLAALAGRSGAWMAVAPAALLLLLAAIDRVPPLSPVVLLALAWGAIGLGVLVAFSVLGVEIGLRSDDDAPVRALVLPATGFALAGLVVATGELRLGARVAGLAWAFVATYAVVGVKRATAGSGRAGLAVIAGATVASGLAVLMRAAY